MKILKFIFGIILATILLIISLVVGVIAGIVIGFRAWNVGLDNFNELMKLRKATHV
jgi:uncharacterized membrane protein